MNYPKTIIASNPNFNKKVEEGIQFLQVSEFFCDTIQGENFIGYPSAFLRLQGCTLNCAWCDTKEVWRFGNPYTINEILDLMEENNLISKFKDGQHLVFTGGSPLRQQAVLLQLIYKFQLRYDFIPFIEIENECTIIPMPQIISFIKCWNNSPKLESSGNLVDSRYKPNVIKILASLPNSWFKFVISSKDDWEEIDLKFLNQNLLRKDQIVLMPCGASRDELINNQQMVVEMAIENSVRYCSREHIMLWDKKTGV